MARKNTLFCSGMQTLLIPSINCAPKHTIAIARSASHDRSIIGRCITCFSANYVTRYVYVRARTCTRGTERSQHTTSDPIKTSCFFSPVKVRGRNSLPKLAADQVKRLQVRMAVQEGSDGRKLAAASPKSKVPPGAIPRGANFVLGGLAG